MCFRWVISWVLWRSLSCLRSAKSPGQMHRHLEKLSRLHNQLRKCGDRGRRGADGRAEGPLTWAFLKMVLKPLGVEHLEPQLLGSRLHGQGGNWTSLWCSACLVDGLAIKEARTSLMADLVTERATSSAR